MLDGVSRQVYQRADNMSQSLGDPSVTGLSAFIDQQLLFRENLLVERRGHHLTPLAFQGYTHLH